MSSRSIRITLIRHGESLANLSQRWQGQGDSALSDLGRSQARALAKRMAQRPFDRIVASDLVRASDTAAALGRPFLRDRSFREFDIGAWEGLTRAEVAERFGDELARLDAGEDIALGGGESYAEFCARVDGALQRLRDALDPGEHALVVCHGGVIGALVAGALGLRKQREVPIARVLNTSISELTYDEQGQVAVRVFNDSLHLAELSLFPHPIDLASSVGLICATSPHEAYGSFAAHYEADKHLAQLLAEADQEPSTVRALLSLLHARHPERRVSFSASAERIHAWAGELLWRELAPGGRLLPPTPGSLCHVGASKGHFALYDYGLSVADDPA